MALTWHAKTLLDKKVWDTGLVTLTYDWEPDFLPGQFVTAAFPGIQRPLRRLYTIASAPKEKVEIYAVKIDNGYLSPKMIDMAVGEQMMFTNKIKGLFTIGHQPNKDILWLISTGTGLAPYISMLRDNEIWQKYKEVVLVHAVRHSSRLSYQDELNNLQATMPLRYLTYFSRNSPNQISSGRLTNVLKSGRLEKDADFKIKASNSHVMLCGNPDMIDDMTAILEKDKGLSIHKKRSPGELTIEKYW